MEIIEQKFEKLKQKNIVKILAIETSCDETSVAIVENGRKIHSNIIATQIDIHSRFGGVVPEIASRNHVLAIKNVCNSALKQAGLQNFEDIDAIAITYGAGLVGALLVGINFAKSLAYALQKPLLKVNHIYGHIASNYLTHANLTPPFTCLVVSGGHTAILNVKDHDDILLVGTTVDDAVGEAFDKVARVLGLAYPGGPKIDNLAKNGKANITFKTKNSLKDSFNFSFSGIKTAVINYINNEKQAGKQIIKEDICASFQTLITNELVSKTIAATIKNGHGKLAVAGGVAANSFLKQSLENATKQNELQLFMPQLSLCTDNAAMIGSMAYFNAKKGLGLADLTLSAKSSLPLSNNNC